MLITKACVCVDSCHSSQKEIPEFKIKKKLRQNVSTWKVLPVSFYTLVNQIQPRDILLLSKTDNAFFGSIAEQI